MRLPHVCTIQKSTAGTADAYGETAPVSWSTDQASVACRFYYYRRAGEQYGRDVSGITTADALMLLLPASATITKAKRVTTTQSGYSGTYAVDAIRTRSNGPGSIHHYEVALREVPA